MRRATACAVVGATALGAGSAHASNVLEFPDNGSEQFARGGAWVARASDPLATFFNPAGLAGQDTRLTVQSNVTLRHACFARVKATSDTTQDRLAGADGAYPKVCADDVPFPNPQVAFVYRASDRVGLGFAVLGPSAAGSATWPEFVDSSTGPQASPQRYLLMKADALLVNPTIGFGAEVVDNLRVGASFSWGLASLKFATASLSLNQGNLQPRDGDIKAELTGHDWFVPSINLGTIWSPTDELDLAGWFRWSGQIDAPGDIKTSVNYFDPQVANGNDSRVRRGDSSVPDCGTGDGRTTCAGDHVGRVTVNQPMEAKLGLRYHVQRPDRPAHRRDPMADDVFDVELDLTWANNSAVDAIRVRFPENPDGTGVIPVVGSGGTIPPNADIPRGYKDVFGVRFGGDYNVIPNRLALRAGAFLESNGQAKQYQNIDFMGSTKVGLSGGVSLRIPLRASDSGAVPAKNLMLMLGFGHIFVADQENKNPGAQGLAGLAGSACNPSSNEPGFACPNGIQKFRTNWPVNLGTITNSVNVINVGAAYRF